LGVDLGDLAAKKAITINDLAGKRIAIDAFNTIYQFLSSVRQADGTPLTDFKGRITSHLSGIFYRNARLLEAGVRPIYVFDGQPPPFKRHTIGERAERKKDAAEKMKEALESGFLAEAKRYAQATSHLTPEMVEESKELLSAMGIPVVQAPSEGEAQASQLVIEGSAYAAGSQDFDCLLFGSPLLVRNLSITGRRKVPRKDEYVQIEPEIISLDETLKAMGISRKQLVWVGILTGNDFNEGIKGIGPKKALKIVAECKSLSDVLAYAKEKHSYVFPEDIKEVEDFFLSPPVEKKLRPEYGLPDAKKLGRILCDEHDFSHERVQKTGAEIEKKLREKGEQSTLFDF
jgi:flap endonuclease-1